MTIDKAMANAIDRLFPEAPDTTLPLQEHLTGVRDQLADAQNNQGEYVQALSRCDADINAARDVEQQIGQLTAKRTDAIANSYLKNLVTGTSTKALDKQISDLQVTLTELKTKAEGAVQARPTLMSQLVAARTVVEALQSEVARITRQITGRAPTAAETEAYERDVFAQQARRRIEGSPENTRVRREEQGREQRIAAEKARQLRQRTLKDGPVP